MDLTTVLNFCRLDLVPKNNWVRCDVSHTVLTCAVVVCGVRLRYQHNEREDHMSNANIYEYLENGGNVMDDIADMSLEDALDYFGDLDIADFL